MLFLLLQHPGSPGTDQVCSGVTAMQKQQKWPLLPKTSSLNRKRSRVVMGKQLDGGGQQESRSSQHISSLNIAFLGVF